MPLCLGAKKVGSIKFDLTSCRDPKRFKVQQGDKPNQLYYKIPCTLVLTVKDGSLSVEVRIPQPSGGDETVKGPDASFFIERAF